MTDGPGAGNRWVERWDQEQTRGGATPLIPSPDPAHEAGDERPHRQREAEQEPSDLSAQSTSPSRVVPAVIGIRRVQLTEVTP